MSISPEQKIPQSTEPVQDAIKKEETNVSSSPQSKEAPASETQEQINWRKFRQEREKDRKDKEAAEKIAHQKIAEAEALKVAMDAILSKPSPDKSETQDLSEEELLQKKIDEAIRKRDVKSNEERAKKDAQELPQKLTGLFPDFDQVCSTENLDYLEYHHPEIARAFKNQPDTINKWGDIYKVVKKMVPNTQSKKEEVRAERNTNKPQSMSIGGATQTGDHAPIELTEKRREANWSRMNRVMRGGK